MLLLAKVVHKGCCCHTRRDPTTMTAPGAIHVRVLCHNGNVNVVPFPCAWNLETPGIFSRLVMKQLWKDASSTSSSSSSNRRGGECLLVKDSAQTTTAAARLRREGFFPDSLWKFVECGRNDTFVIHIWATSSFIELGHLSNFRNSHLFLITRIKERSKAFLSAKRALCGMYSKEIRDKQKSEDCFAIFTDCLTSFCSVGVGSCFQLFTNLSLNCGWGCHSTMVFTIFDVDCPWFR